MVLSGSPDRLALLPLCSMGPKAVGHKGGALAYRLFRAALISRCWSRFLISCRLS